MARKIYVVRLKANGELDNRAHKKVKNMTEALQVLKTKVGDGWCCLRRKQGKEDMFVTADLIEQGL